MFFFRKKKLAVSAYINDLRIGVEPGETLLRAALRQDVDFPHNCRIGACGVCKSKLLKGQIKPITDSSFVLSNSEIADGYILACQCLPLTDVSISVDLCGSTQKAIEGTIVAQHRLTHDITSLSMELDEKISYKAGQFADLTVDNLPDVTRSYSFATPAGDGRVVEFFVRKVDGGRLSSLINDSNLVGRSAKLRGPAGDFWLRSSDSPLLFLAGGSGLAPILAILKQAASERCERSATLLFGARASRDLYALQEIESIGRNWRGRFRFTPVLSESAADDRWTGLTGFVTEHLDENLEAGADCYVCGPPAMVDAASSTLDRLGISASRIFADRFTTRGA